MKLKHVLCFVSVLLLVRRWFLIELLFCMINEVNLPVFSLGPCLKKRFVLLSFIYFHF